MLTYLQAYLTFDLNTFSFFVIAEEKETNNSCRKVWTYGREYGKYFIKWRGKYVVMCFLSRLREFESLVLVHYQNRDCFWYAERETPIFMWYIFWIFMFENMIIGNIYDVIWNWPSTIRDFVNMVNNNLLFYRILQPCGILLY